MLVALALMAEMTALTPHGPVPSLAQREWHQMEYYGFLHFTTNTFTDKEWGYGDESPEVFNPTDFDADQMARVAKAAGMTGLILTAKHHDGFCLWPTKTTPHNVSASPFRRDVVRLVSDACRRVGLKFGVYLSPWDRNSPHYGTPRYVEIYREQLRELLTQYGPIFEVWHDGANGGDGHYGGARETRRIDPRTYYDWPNTWALIRKLQPRAVIFSDVGPDVRWVGNERGIAADPCWATFTPVPPKGQTVAAPGFVDESFNLTGTRHGAAWIPAEADVSIRPGWFYHAHEDDKVKTPEQLKSLYLQSVGRGASFLLNIPPDRRGQIHPIDEASLMGFRALRDAMFAHDFVRRGELAEVVTSSAVAGHPGSAVADDRPNSFWCAAQNDAWFKLRFQAPIRVNTLRLREAIALGQRIEAVSVTTASGEVLTEFESVGSCRIAQFPAVTVSELTFRFRGSAPPCISEVGVFFDPGMTD